MKEQIFKYLLEAGKGVEAAKVLEDVLNIHSPNSSASNHVLTGILGQDPRFTFNEGRWQISSHPGESLPGDLSRAVVLHLRSPRRADNLKWTLGAMQQADGCIQEFTAETSVKIFGRMRSAIDDHPVVVWSSRELRLWNALLQTKDRKAAYSDYASLHGAAQISGFQLLSLLNHDRDSLE